MVQGIASQILSETPSSLEAPVNASTSESTETNTNQPQADKSPDFDSRFSVLTKMERKVKEAEAKMREQEREWAEKQKRFQELEEIDKLLQENPLEALKRKKGWGVQEFNEWAVQNSSDEDLDPVAKITKNFTSRIEEVEKTWEQKLNDAIKAKEEEILKRDQEKQVSEFKGELKAFLAENKDSYEFIHAEEGAMEEVFNLIYQDVQKQLEDGIPQESLKIMDMKDAADKVEAFLDKQYSKYLSLNKVKSKLTGSNEQLVQFVANKSKEEPKTLTSSFSPKSKPIESLSAEERKQQAVAFLRSQHA
jgi:hypothetical protein